MVVSEWQWRTSVRQMAVSQFLGALHRRAGMALADVAGLSRAGFASEQTPTARRQIGSGLPSCEADWASSLSRMDRLVFLQPWVARRWHLSRLLNRQLKRRGFRWGPRQQRLSCQQCQQGHRVLGWLRRLPSWRRQRHRNLHQDRHQDRHRNRHRNQNQSG